MAFYLGLLNLISQNLFHSACTIPSHVFPVILSFFYLPAEQFVEKSSCAQPLGELTSLDAHGEFGSGGSSPPSSALCTEPLIPTTPIIPSEEMAKISCSLETKELWDKFHELGTEMIITKSGR